VSPRFFSLVLLTLCLTGSWGLHAQDDAAALFDKGLEAMLAGDYEQGCPDLAESYRLEPMAGALFTLAECEAKWGKSRVALEHYEQYVASLTEMEAAKRQRHEPRREVAARQIEALRAQVPKLTIVMGSTAPADTTVTLDGEPVEPASLGVARYVDVGSHQVSASAPGYEPVERNELLSEGDERTVVLELQATEAVGDGPSSDGSTQRTLAYVVAGVGVAALLVSAITGGVALANKGVVDDHCVDYRCDAEGKDAADEGQTLADVSTATLIVGGVALGAGVALWLTAPGSREMVGATPRWATAGRGAMLSVEGRW
jgi:hypothetical protein